MKKQDMMKVLVGMVVGIGLVVTVGAAAKVKGLNYVGRFQIVSSPGTVYMVDRMTGQAWTHSDQDFKESKVSEKAFQHNRIDPDN